MLELKNVSVTVDSGIFRSHKKKILSGISFMLPNEGALGIAGQSGSGKTTIANVILGLARHSTGEVLIDGKPAHLYSRMERAKKVQLVTQNPETSFDPDLSMYEAFREVLKIHKMLTKNTVLEDIVRPLLCDVGLENVNLKKRPRHFSGGELQRMSIVRALLVSPETLIFDEADSMLDTALRIKLYDTLGGLKEKYRLSYMFVTHDIRVLPHLVDSVLVLSAGKAVEYGPVDILRTSGEPFIKELRDSIFMETNRQPHQRKEVWK